MASAVDCATDHSRGDTRGVTWDRPERRRDAGGIGWVLASARRGSLAGGHRRSGHRQRLARDALDAVLIAGGRDLTTLCRGKTHTGCIDRRARRLSEQPLAQVDYHRLTLLPHPLV